MFFLEKYIIKAKQFLRRLKRDRRQRKKVADWISSGCPDPPPQSIKARELASAQAKYDLNVFVETGTYKGDTLDSLAKQFHKLYSIELSPHYYEKARDRFRFDQHIELLLGDSGDVLGEIVKLLKEPALFWLDGHYSGGKTALGVESTPIYREMDYILSSPYNHVVFIDDARCFGSEDGYPSLEEFIGQLRKKGRNFTHEVKLDSIRIYFE